MQNIAVVVLGVFFGLKDVFSGKYGRKLQVALLGIGAFFVFDFFVKKEQKQAALDSAPDNASSSFAIRLHDALVPSGLDWLNSWFGDGTDDDVIKSIAIEMSSLQNFSEVSGKYRTLYKSELTTDLEKDGVFELFQLNYSKKSTAVVVSFKVGQSLRYTASNWNIRSVNSPFLPIAKTVAGAMAGSVVVSIPVLLSVKNANGTVTKDRFLQLKNAAGLRYFVSTQILK